MYAECSVTAREGASWPRADMTRFSLRSKTNIYVRHSLNSLSAAPQFNNNIVIIAPMATESFNWFSLSWWHGALIYILHWGRAPIKQAGLWNIITIMILGAVKTWCQTEAIRVTGVCPELRSRAIVVWCRENVLWISGLTETRRTACFTVFPLLVAATDKQRGRVGFGEGRMWSRLHLLSPLPP